MKLLKYACLSGALLTLAACGQMGAPEVIDEPEITVLDESLVTNDVDASISSVSFGTICKDAPASRSVRLYAVATGRGNGNGNGNNIWANGANLTVSGAMNAAGSTAGFASTSGGPIQLPNNWQSYSNNQRSPNKAQPTITLNTSTTGTKSGQITYTLSGTGSSSPTAKVTKTVTISVSATVVSCNEAPVINVQSMEVEGDTLGGWAFSIFSLYGTATDTEDGTPAVVCSPAVGSVLVLGRNSVTCTATDSDGLTDTASGTITVTDNAPPVISGMPSNITEEATGPNGATASWTAPTASDIVAGPRPVSCDRESGSIFALGTTTVTCSASDGNGNSDSEGFTVTVEDTTAPTLTDLGPTAGPDGKNGWYKSAVTNTFRAADLVGFAGDLENPHTFTKSSGTAEGSAVKISSGSVSDAAGNPNSGIDSAEFKIDLTAPTSRVTGVTQGDSYTIGSVPAAACSSSDNLSSVVTPATPTTTGGPIGSVTVSCNGAVDGAGNVQTQASSSVTYTVVYNFTGFLSPIDMNGVYNVAKAGSAIPVKFKLGGDYGLNVITTIKSLKVACPSTMQADSLEETVSGTTSGLKYDSTADQYNYTWKTATSLAGTCQRLEMQLNDGSILKTALFKFNK